MYKVRPIELQDNFALAQLIRSVFIEFEIDKPGTVFTDPSTDNLYQLFLTKGANYYVVTYENEVVGGCGYFPTDGLPPFYAELVKFYISPAHRSNGLGHLLLEKIIEETRVVGYQYLYLETFPELSRALSIYLRKGFVHIDSPLGHSGHFACTVWMKKKL
jgi:putative acetyltransferase